MGVELRLELDIDKYDELISNIRKDNNIYYDYNIYSILINNTITGYIIRYKVPANKSCYLDIFMLPDYRNRGYGTMSLSLFIDNFLSNYNEIYIRSNQIDKNRFLINNNFKFVEENLNKNLYLKVLKS